eukprot:CAMPEP_0170454696 /NCGR_PEP_ID=MMETSP0123-20130129/2857_1 /TAXON_ID=182087 /ORGANISM="Favella ehrenbergii, Strain Fehren 1" /LENGTH=102 /DNA_ID=CAMNT_0010717485 /DNA_START=1187 /DNA_END=1495 /DNA_ORIENTATION=+
MIASKAGIARMMSSKINDRHIIRNKTTVAGIKQMGNEDVTHTNSGIWGDLVGTSTTHSNNLMSNSRLLAGHAARSAETLDVTLQNIMQIVDSNKGQPELMKR